jgi:hypothetical protein
MQEKIKKEKTNYDDLDYNDNESNDDYYNDKNEEDKSNNEENEDKMDIGEEEFKDIQDEPRDFSSKLPFLNNQGKSGGLNNIEQGSEIYLTEMLGFDYNDIENDDDDTTEDDLIYLKDIDFNFILKDFLMDFFKSFYKSDELYLTECLKLLPRDDQKMFKGFGILNEGSDINFSTANSIGSANNSDTTSKTK